MDAAEIRGVSRMLDIGVDDSWTLDVGLNNS